MSPQVDLREARRVNRRSNEDRKKRTIRFNYSNPDYIIPICEQIGMESGNSAPFEIWQHNAADKSIIITFKNQELYEKRMKNPTMRYKGSEVNFFPFAQFPTAVRVRGIPVDMNDEIISDAFRMYGGINNIKECRGRVPNSKFLDGVPNGDKWLIMNLKDPIPRSINFRGCRFTCYYPGQPESCVYCRGPGHNSDTCPKLFCELCKSQGHNSKRCPNFAQCKICNLVHAYDQCPSGRSGRASANSDIEEQDKDTELNKSFENFPPLPPKTPESPLRNANSVPKPLPRRSIAKAKRALDFKETEPKNLNQEEQAIIAEVHPEPIVKLSDNKTNSGNKIAECPKVSTAVCRQEEDTQTGEREEERIEELADMICVDIAIDAQRECNLNNPENDETSVSIEDFKGKEEIGNKNSSNKDFQCNNNVRGPFAGIGQERKEELVSISTDVLGNLSGRSTPESIDMPAVMKKVVSEENEKKKSVDFSNIFRDLTCKNIKKKSVSNVDNIDQVSIISDNCSGESEMSNQKKMFTGNEEDSDQEVIIAAEMSTPKKKKVAPVQVREYSTRSRSGESSIKNKHD